MKEHLPLDGQRWCICGNFKDMSVEPIIELLVRLGAVIVKEPARGVTMLVGSKAGARGKLARKLGLTIKTLTKELEDYILTLAECEDAIGSVTSVVRYKPRPYLFRGKSIPAECRSNKYIPIKSVISEDDGKPVRDFFNDWTGSINDDAGDLKTALASSDVLTKIG